MHWPHNEPAVTLSQSERAPQLFFFLLASPEVVSSPLAVYHCLGVDDSTPEAQMRPH